MMHRILCFFGWHTDGRMVDVRRTIEFDNGLLEFTEHVFVCNRCGFEETYDTAF